MRNTQTPTRQDYGRRFPRTFVVGNRIHTTENGQFVMYTSGEQNLAFKEFDYRG